MTNLEEILTRLCPNGVEYKVLSEVATVTAGNSAPQKAELFENGIYPFCRTADVGRAGHSADFCDIKDKLNEEGIKGLRLFPKGSILIPKSGASTLSNNKVRLAIDSYVVSHLAVVIPKENVDSRYLYYALERVDILPFVGDISYPSVKSSVLAEGISIPLPHLEAQREIVRILDNFTELTAELTARNKQYEYYRDELLHLEGERITIQELFDTRNGFTPSKDNPKFWENGSLPWFKLDDINDKGRVLSESYLHITPKALKKSGLFPKDSIIISTSATIGEYALITVPFLCNQRFTCMTVKNSIKKR